MTDDRPVVLVVDDEPNVVGAYALYLGDEYVVRTAEDGDEALEEFDEAVDVVLLDRRMPGPSGDEVLTAIRDRGYDCRIAMVTAVDPDVDIVEMGFDDYLTKPVTREALVETVDQLLTLAEVDETAREGFALARKRAALESELTAAELEASEEYAALTERLADLRDESAAAIADLDAETANAAFRDRGDG